MAAPKRDPIAERVVPGTPDTPPRREDAPATVPPDSLPPMAQQTPPADGGVAEHPIHDDELDDFDPEDYETEIDELEQTGGLRPD
jgi:hypothetical protein